MFERQTWPPMHFEYFLLYHGPLPTHCVIFLEIALRIIRTLQPKPKRLLQLISTVHNSKPTTGLVQKRGPIFVGHNSYGYLGFAVEERGRSLWRVQGYILAYLKLQEV